MVDPAYAPGVRLLRVPDGTGGRVDRFVAEATGLSRSYVQKLISDGRLTAAGEALRANTIVGAGTELRLDVPEPVAYDLAPAPDIPLTVVYEDDDLLIVDKPAGLVVHPAPGHSGDTLVNALLARADGTAWGGIAGVQRPGIVHRLDRDTSGLLMVARHDAAQASLMAQLKARRVKKTYLALVQGSVSAARRPDRGADRARPEAPDADGRRARRAARRSPATACASGSPAGRCSSSTSSPAGPTRSASTSRRSATRSPATRSTARARRGADPDGLERLFLHAWRLELASPTDGHLIRATAPLPPELESVLDGLREAVR